MKNSNDTMTEVTPRLKNSKVNTFIDHTLLCFITLTLTLQKLRLISYFKLQFVPRSEKSV